MIRTLAFLLSFSVAAAACASSRTGIIDDGPSSIRIAVRNFNFNDATLHAHRGSERIRLGIVTGKSDASFNLRWTYSRPLWIEIDLLAAGGCATREMIVNPGDVVQLQISVDLRLDPDCRQPSLPTEMTIPPTASVPVGSARKSP